MKNLNLLNIVTAATLIATCSTASAEPLENAYSSETAISDIEYTCEHNTSKRIIRVFKNTAAGLACEVTYEKATGTQTLWTASNDQEYCAQKAAEFAAKQAGWGWLCFNQDGEIISAPLEEPAEEASIIETPTEEIPAIEAGAATTEVPAEMEAIEVETHVNE